MPRYSFQVEGGETSCELHGIELPDVECAETFVVDLISELFNRGEVFDSDGWSECLVHLIVESSSEVVTRTAGEIAMIEREHRRGAGARWVVN